MNLMDNDDDVNDGDYNIFDDSQNSDSDGELRGEEPQRVDGTNTNNESVKGFVPNLYDKIKGRYADWCQVEI